MAKIKVTPELLKEYFNDKKKYRFYDEAVKEAKSLTEHANRLYPQDAIDERRPNEPDVIKAYRKKIYRSQTKGPIQKVINELMKLRKADDWSVLYKYDKVSTIKEGNEPERYFEKEFPAFGSVTNWTFTVLLKSYLLEANSVILTMPINLQSEDQTELLKPFPFWFPCESVIEFIEGELCILKSVDKYTYQQDKNTYTDGDIYYVVTDTSITKYNQTSTTRQFTPDPPIVHKLGYLPAYKVKGQFMKAREGSYLYESRIAPMLDHLDEVAREYSDLQAEVVQHMHSEKWVFDPEICQKCKGAKKIRIGNPAELTTCDQCKGEGYVMSSPYMTTIIKRAKPGETQWTGDPAGFIKRDTEIIKIQDARIDKHIWKALSTVSMEFLAEVPLNESGRAKEVDRDNLNTFINTVGEDIVHIMDQFYKIAIDYRYRLLVPDPAVRETMAPKIAVPTKLDVLSANYLVTEISALKNGKVNPIIIIASEIELANKKFANNPDVRDRLVSVLELDPLAGITNDDKASMLSNKGVTIEDYIVSCNIHTLVNLAFEKNPKFATLPLEKKNAEILKLAAEKIKAAKTTIDVSGLPPEEEEEDPEKPAEEEENEE